MSLIDIDSFDNNSFFNTSYNENSLNYELSSDSINDSSNYFLNGPNSPTFGYNFNKIFSEDINMNLAYLNEETKVSTDKIKLNKNEFLNKKRENLVSNLFLSKKTNKIKGRPKKEEKNNKELIYTHKKDSRDNICQKIKGYLLELYRTEFNKIIKKYGFEKLYKIDATIYTKKFKGQDNLDLLDTPMLTIFKNITKKYNVDPNHNIEIIEKLANKNNYEINNYLEMTFGQFFELATNQNKNESLLEKNIFDIINEKFKNDDSDYKETLINFCDVNTYKDFWKNRASRLY